MDKNEARVAAGGVIPVIDVHRRLRIARDMFDTRITQDEFGALVGMSGNTVSNYETGATTRIKDVYVEKWAQVTGVDYWWLKTGHAPDETGPTGPVVPPTGIEPATFGTNVRGIIPFPMHRIRNGADRGTLATITPIGRAA